MGVNFLAFLCFSFCGAAPPYFLISSNIAIPCCICKERVMNAEMQGRNENVQEDYHIYVSTMERWRKRRQADSGVWQIQTGRLYVR